MEYRRPRVGSGKFVSCSGVLLHCDAALFLTEFVLRYGASSHSCAFLARTYVWDRNETRRLVEASSPPSSMLHPGGE
jgi:competence transcription factor ComK